MVATTGLPSGAALASAKKAAAARAAALKKPRAKPTHPRTSDMVDAAIVALKEKGGSSLQAIKKYITATYKIDAEKLSPFIKKYLKSAVVGKKLVQTKGKGASGSFKLSLGDGAVKKVKKVAPGAAKKKPVTAAVKKSVAAKKKPTVRATKKAASPKKKVLKTLAAKPPKPKVSKAKPAAKKPAAKPAARKPPANRAKKTSARKVIAKK